jgi:Ca2+-binding EF-hand superfamily protein
MKLAQTLFFLVAAALALAVGSVNAADKAKTDSKASAGATSDKIGTDKNDPGFNNLDKNHDGYLSRKEAAGNPALAAKFKDADRNGDGKLSRSEYLMTMTAQDARTAKKKMESAMDKHDDKASGAGSTSESTKSK